MDTLETTFRERLSEIESYLDLLAEIEVQVQSGPPRFSPGGPIISVKQQRILYSSVYLQLYNLVEATVTKCIEAVTAAISRDAKWTPGDLSDDLRREWVRYVAKTHTEMAPETRLNYALALCSHLLSALPVGEMDIHRGGGGNWDDKGICKLAERLGCKLFISSEAQEAVKRPFKNELGAMSLIVSLRNNLAHGALSFAECGDGIVVAELRELTNRTAMYLFEVVVSFKQYIDHHAFISEARRPIGALA